MSQSLFFTLILTLISTMAQAGPIRDQIINCYDSEKCVNTALIKRIRQLADPSLEEQLLDIKSEMLSECHSSELSCQGVYVLKAINKAFGKAEQNRREETERRRERELEEERRRERELEEERRREREERRRQRERLQCIGNNFYGFWAQGGGCNYYGCWYAGGGCNFYGCWYAGGSCNFYGCIKKAPATKKACRD